MSLITYVTRIHFADGVVDEALPAELDELGIGRPLVVTDPGVAEAGLLERVRDTLPEAATPVLFTDSPRRPLEAAAARLAVLYLEHACDGLVALGGGTVIDLAKVAALLVSHGGPLSAFAAGGGRARPDPRRPAADHRDPHDCRQRRRGGLHGRRRARGRPDARALQPASDPQGRDL